LAGGDGWSSSQAIELKPIDVIPCEDNAPPSHRPQRSAGDIADMPSGAKGERDRISRKEKASRLSGSAKSGYQFPDKVALGQRLKMRRCRKSSRPEQEKARRFPAAPLYDFPCLSAGDS
jgi:hypothetical protein